MDYTRERVSAVIEKDGKRIPIAYEIKPHYGPVNPILIDPIIKETQTNSTQETNETPATEVSDKDVTPASLNPIVAEKPADAQSLSSVKELTEMKKALIHLVEAKKSDETEKIVSNKKDGKNELLSAYECKENLIKIVTLKNVKGGIYFFTGIIYELLTNDRLEQLIVKKLRCDISRQGYSGFVVDIRKWLYMEPDICFTPTKSDHLIAFKNGVLDISSTNFDDSNFLLPSPKFFLTSFIDIEFKKDASECTPVFDAFLYKVTNGETILIARMWEVLGYLLTPDMTPKKFILLQGVGDSGKSVFGKFVTSLFDSNATSHIDLFSFGERFSLHGLVGKRINASLDLPSGKLNAQAVSIIKQLTGGDVLTAEAKYEKPFSFVNTCKLIFATNHCIKLTEADQAFEDRCLVVPFKYAIPKQEQDHHLLEKFEKEKVSIVRKALKAYVNLKAKNYIFAGEELVSQTIDAVILTEEISVRNFIDTCCEFTDSDSGTFTQLLHDAFFDFCKRNNLTFIPNIVRFSTILKNVCGDKIVKAKWRNSTICEGPQNGYKGIILK